MIMDFVQAGLYQRLQDFELDDPSHEFGFTRHLMKSHGWSLDYAQRAIVEYKKFAFLAVVSNHQVVPSDQVDQVWHAHVLLTQSYWEGFCPLVLQKSLHHHPARGGKEERAEFHQLYAQTIISYRQFFGYPPVDIWSPSDRRFGVELKMQRVNVAEHWMIPKRLPQIRLSQSAISLMMAIGVGLITVGCVDRNQTFTLNEVFTAYVVFILGLFLMIKLIRYGLRMPQKAGSKPQLDIYEIAYFFGSNKRAVDLAITQLVAQGYLKPNVRNRTFGIIKPLPDSAAYLERQVMQQVTLTPEFAKLHETVGTKTEFLVNRLQQQQLLLKGWVARLSSSFTYFLVISLLGLFFVTMSGFLIGYIQGNLNITIPMRDELIWVALIFEFLWIFIGLISLCCWIPSRRTHWGNQIMTEIRKTHDVHDLAQAFAVTGFTVLSGGQLDDLKQIFQKVAEEEAAASSCGCGC
jgi:uncharacterized protein (TIGR04222 family)